jgi:hypothetical protein
MASKNSGIEDGKVKVGLLLFGSGMGLPLILALPTIEYDCRSIKRAKLGARCRRTILYSSSNGMDSSLSRMKNAAEMNGNQMGRINRDGVA